MLKDNNFHQMKPHFIMKEKAKTLGKDCLYETLRSFLKSPYIILGSI